MCHGANIYQKDIRGNTPYDDAHRENRTEIIDFLDNNYDTTTIS